LLTGDRSWPAASTEPDDAPAPAAVAGWPPHSLLTRFSQSGCLHAQEEFGGARSKAEHVNSLPNEVGSDSNRLAAAHVTISEECSRSLSNLARRYLRFRLLPAA
jgi:hypothetical protein